MFSRSFVTQIIQPSAAGNPQVLAHSVTWASQVMLHHIAVYNGIFAAVQLVIAVGLFFRRTVKITLAASIVWALFVWWFGESLGGIFGGASPLNGLPAASCSTRSSPRCCGPRTDLLGARGPRRPRRGRWDLPSPR